MTDALSRLKSALSDRYTIERELGAGGMATVYLAEDLKHHRKVAVKVLRPDLAAALGPERFLQEIEIAAQLQHPNILALYDSGEADGFLFYVMPYIEGPSLRDKLAKEGELPVGDAVRILRDVVDALTEAHQHGVVHRDIKPENILLRGRHALVTDFGVAKAVSEATGREKLTTAGIALGTPAYMAPEQASADPHLDQRVDIYAVGAVAYELLTGRPVFMGTTPQMILSAHMTEAPQPVTKHRDTVPAALESVVMRCLEKRPADRWQSAEELLPQLEALATPSGGTTPVGTVPVRAVTRARNIAIGAAVAAVVLAAIVVVMLLPRGSALDLDPDRVLVAVFENQTGDPTLDPLGAMAGHWITQGLQKSGVVQVVPWMEAQQASQYVASDAAAGNVRNRITALAEETGAATVISGAYYRRGETVQYQVEVTDAMRGRSLGALDPEIASLDSPDDAIEPLVQRVMGFLAISVDDRIAAQAAGMGHPPSYDAYRAFEEGLGRYIRRLNDPEAIPYLLRAYELDTAFVTPLFYAVLTQRNTGQFAQADSVLSVLKRRRDQLSDHDQHWLDYLVAENEGDLVEALDAISRAAELAPGSKAVFNQAWVAGNINRPREAIDALLTLDANRGPMRGFNWYFYVLVRNYLALGEHENALHAARRFRATFGDDPVTLGYEALALAGLGRRDQVDILIDEIIALPEDGLQQGVEIIRVAAFERRQGQIEAARSTVDKAIQWYEARIPETKSTAHWQWLYAVALYVADRCDEAYRVAVQLSQEFPEDVANQGLVGLLAACRGNEEEALQVSHWLASLDEPYLWGLHTLYRTMIAGALGDWESAVALWRQATEEGCAHPNPFSWSWVAVEPIRDYPQWQELMRPKG